MARKHSLLAALFVAGSLMIIGLGCSKKEDVTQPPCAIGDTCDTLKGIIEQHLWAWTPPLTGPPVKEYNVEVARPGRGRMYTTAPDTFTLVDLIDKMHPYKIRVAAIDSIGRQGLWSDYAMYTPNTTPDSTKLGLDPAVAPLDSNIVDIRRNVKISK